MTLLVSACGLLIGAAIGGFVAWARLSGKLLGRLGQTYAALFRGLPELLIVYFVYFGTSTILTETALFSVTRALSGACLCRGRARRRRHLGRLSGGSVPRRLSRHCARRARGRGELGMNRALMARRIIVPQVLRFALPGLGNLWQVALKIHR